MFRYRTPDPHKMFDKILDRLYDKYLKEQNEFLQNKSGYGRALTGDGATVLGTKFLNFLLHELGKGTMLCKIQDCTERLTEVGAIEGTYIALLMIAVIRSVHCLLMINALLKLMFIIIFILDGRTRRPSI